MRTVFLTGASSGIGEAIAGSLLAVGDCVYGVGRDFSGTDPGILSHPSFHRLDLDLRDTDKVEACLSGLFQAGVSFDVLINCAGSAWYGLHEGIAQEHIFEMTQIDLAVPMVLSGIFLRRFRQQRRGTILNIASVTAISSENPHGAAYGACKAGLLSFSRSIFAEARKCGVKVTCILPDMTDTNLYRNADFAASKEEGCSLTPEDVAEAVRLVLDAPDHLCVPEVVLTPQYHRIEKKKPNQN
ncbi:MAG: SDR family NAD(P)-dependent oxidoreductase [Lachnospiraceae bacterium]